MNLKQVFDAVRKNVPYILFFSLIIIIQVAVILYYTNERHNLYIDEIWTFNTANHYYFPFLFQNNESYLNTWLPASFWANSIVVNPDHTFSYESVFYNMSLDHHPPLYIAVIHTVCSLFPGEFSRWFGIVPNLIFFVLGQMTFYLIGVKLFENKPAALSLCLLLGSTWGTINNVMLIRMYTMLTLFALLFFYANLQLLDDAKEQKSSKNTLFLLYFCSICGFLTHYYFLIYASYLFLGTVVLLIFNHRKHIIIRYFYTLLGALLSCVLINPCIPAQIFGFTGHLGTETWHYLLRSDFMHRAAVMSRCISEDLLGHKARMVIFLIIVLVLAKVILNVLKKRNPDTSDAVTVARQKESRALSLPFRLRKVCPGVFLAAVVSSAYFITAAKIVPYYQNRYMYIIYPFIIICVFSILRSLLQSLLLRKGMSLVLTVLIVLGLNINHCNRRNIALLDDSHFKMLDTIRNKYSNVNMITVTNTSNWWPVVSNILVYREVPNTLMMDESKLSEIDRVVNSLPSNPDSVLVYRGISCKTKPQDFVKLIKKTTGFSKHIQFGRQHFGEVYLFFRN